MQQVQPEQPVQAAGRQEPRVRRVALVLSVAQVPLETQEPQELDLRALPALQGQVEGQRDRQVQLELQVPQEQA